ncbi:hypothetical protein JKF63_04181 [Porcisia hertigi]|uniref:Uncharacterized protein n=1 Tax=Porcisia hertigi TaxID=2761500 RepID=A0A836INK3_9TRYP|nr:hypothetical protein JKF63_04181 [Porcisia hertigi]
MRQASAASGLNLLTYINQRSTLVMKRGGKTPCRPRTPLSVRNKAMASSTAKRPCSGQT